MAIFSIGEGGILDHSKLKVPSSGQIIILSFREGGRELGKLGEVGE